MIKSIIFDWGSVLIDNPSPKIIAYCAKNLHITEKTFITEYRKYEYHFQEGKISEDVLWENICSQLNIQKPTMPSLWKNAFTYAYSKKPEVFSLASALKNYGYKMGFLSNAEVPAMRFFHEQHYDMFDVCVFSCVEGIRKPDKKIYTITLERLQVQPSEAIFIDDKKENIRSAEYIGMNTILFKNEKQLRQELSTFSIRV